MIVDVFLIISNYENRIKVHGVFTREKVEETYRILDSCKPDSFIREKLGSYNTKYYRLSEDGNQIFEEQLYVQKQQLVGDIKLSN